MGQLPQRAGSLGLNGGGAAAAVPPQVRLDWVDCVGLYLIVHSNGWKDLIKKACCILKLCP